MDDGGEDVAADSEAPPPGKFRMRRGLEGP